MWKRLLAGAILAHTSFSAGAASGIADSYPNKPIRIIGGLQAGGGVDYQARVIGPKLTERFGQPVIVDNRPGAGGNLAAEMAARATPDGYTLFLGVSTALASSPSLYARLGYDLMKDFTYISRIATGTNVLLVHPSVPVKSVAELVALARSRPQAIRYASSGVGSAIHLTTELLQRRTGMELVHVPYAGPQSVIAVASGEVEIGFAAIAPAMPMIQAKRLNALAVASIKRIAVLAEVPTIAESGYPGFDVTNTYGILAPARTPPAVVEVLNAELRNIVQMEDVRAKFAAQGLEAVGSTPAEYRAVMEAEKAQWTRVINEAHITAN